MLEPIENYFDKSLSEHLKKKAQAYQNYLDFINDLEEEEEEK